MSFKVLLKYNWYKLHIFKVYILMSLTSVYTPETVIIIKITNISIAPKVFLYPFVTHSPNSLVSRQPLICYLSLNMSLYFLEFSMSGITENVRSFVWLLLCNMVILWFIHPSSQYPLRPSNIKIFLLLQSLTLRAVVENDSTYRYLDLTEAF